jgi:hypothetical protein
VSRRVLGALTGVILLGGVAALQLITPRTVQAAQCSAPHVSSVSPALSTAGQIITVTGTGFTCGGQGNGTTLTVGGSGQHITALSDGQMQFQASGAAGSVVVTVSYPVLLGSQSQSSNTDRLFLIVPVAANNTATPGPNGGFTVSGSGFTMGGYVKSITASACGTGLAVGGISDTSVALTAPGSYCNGGVGLAVTGYATSTKNATILTNTVSIGAGGLDVAPSPGGLSTGSAAPGDLVSFSGAGFGTSGSATLNGQGVPSNWSDNSISFTVQPASTSGAVVFTRADGRTINAGNFTVNSKITGVSAARAQDGDTITINGTGFAGGGSVSLGGTGLPVKSWSATSIVVTIPAGAAGGDLTVSPQGNAPATVPNGITVMHIAAIKPGDGAPGATIGITGGGFGSQKGNVTIAGVNAPVTIWGDSTIAVVVPSIPKYAGSGGDDHIVVDVPGAASALSAAFHVDPVPPPSPASTPGGGGGGGAQNTPGNTPGSVPTIDPITGLPTSSASASPNGQAPSFIPPSSNGPIIQIGPVPFHPAPKASGPVDLVLTPSKATADPGQDVPFTVTLTAFGQPVVGAPVDLLLVVVPGGDASISPAKGVTDAQGKVSGVLHLSKRAGDHIILARSGQYSDEIKVTGRGLASTGGSGSTNDGGVGGGGGGSPQRTIIVAALLACLVLFLSGFGINVATARRPAVAAATAARPKRGFRGSVVALPVNAGSAAQFGLAMMVCSFGQLVAVMRRR